MQIISFTQIWDLLNPLGEFRSREQACRRAWEGYTPQERLDIFERIREKQRMGQHVSPNPYFAIQDNSPAQQPQPLNVPTNYNGSTLTPPAPIKPACYKGEWGMYTQQDIDLFNLKTKDKNGMQ